MTDSGKTVPDGAPAAGEETVYEPEKTGRGAGLTQAIDRLAAGMPEEDGFGMGSLLLKTYRITSEALRGGMGSVWRVHHTAWNTDLAMKRPLPRLSANETVRENFISECQSWIDLGLHPNIVTCFYIREIGGVPTIFSEWMENGSLEDRIQDGTLYEGEGTEVPARLLDIAIQFARGLRYAHDSGLIHQDVKPDNLLLTRDWQAKVADFGLANALGQKIATDQPESGGATRMAAGGGYTPAYCSLEQMEGKPLTRRTDLYSWAVSVLEMYLGSRPWQNGVVAGMTCRDYFGGCRVSLPEALGNLLAKCMEIDPDSRPHDFGLVENELLEIYRDVLGTPYPRPEPSASAGDAGSLNNRALSYLDLGDAEKAKSAWEQALQGTPSHLDTVYNQGLYQWRSGLISPEELRHRIDNAQGEDSVRDRLRKAFETERKPLEPKVIRKGMTGYWNDRPRTICAMSPSGDRAWILCNDADREKRKETGDPGELPNSLSCYRLNREKLTWELLYTQRMGLDQKMPDFLELTPDGKYLLFNYGLDEKTKTGDCMIRIAEADTGAVIRTVNCGARAVCFHPNGRYFYVYEDSQKVTKWEFLTCRKVFEYDPSGHEMYLYRDDIIRLCVSPDGSRLYGAAAAYITVWEEATGKKLKQVSRYKARDTEDIRISPDGKTLYTCGGEGVVVWNTRNMRKTLLPSDQKVTRLCLSTDGNRLLCADVKGKIQLWDPVNGSGLHSFWGQQGPVHSLSASGDLSVFLSCGTGRTAYLWKDGRPEDSAPWEVSRIRSYTEQISQKQESERLTEEMEIALDRGDIDHALALLNRAEIAHDPLAFLPMRRKLMTCCRHEGLLDTMDLADFEIPQIRFPKQPMTPCASPRGEGCAFADRFHQKYRIYSETGEEIAARATQGVMRVYNLRYSRSGRFLSAGGLDSAVVWDMDSKKKSLIIRGFKSVQYSNHYVYVREEMHRPDVKTAISPDEKLLLAGDYDEAGLWSLSDGTLLRHLRTGKSGKCRVTDVGFSAGGEYALVSDFDGDLGVYRVQTGEAVTILHPFPGRAPEAIIFHFHLSPDGTRLYVCGKTRIAVYNAEYWTMTGYFQPFAQDSRGDFCISPDGLLAAANDPEGIRIWDLRERKILREFPALTPGRLGRCLAFSPDSSVLYVAIGNHVHTIALRQRMTFPGWADWDPAADVPLRNFLAAYPKPGDAEAEVFRKELQALGLGFIRPEAVMARVTGKKPAESAANAAEKKSGARLAPGKKPADPAPAAARFDSIAAMLDATFLKAREKRDDKPKK